MQTAPTPPARPPSAPGSATAAAYGHPSLPMLSGLGPPGTMHGANGAPLPPFIPEGGGPHVQWWAGQPHAHHPYGHGHGHAMAAGGSSRPPSRTGSARGRTSRGGWSAPRSSTGQYSNDSMSLDQDLSGDLSGPSHGEHGDAAHAAQAASASTPHGPPFVCAACKQTYSRLEYLRRHERRHADIRPFVCECGKGFSRSDVLGRHKKQCKAVVGENGSNKDADSPNDRDQGGPPAKKQRRSVGGARKKKSPEQPSSLDPSLPTLTG